MERWEGRVALVTGASAGFGAAIAKRLVEHGLKVVGCARNIAKIQERAQVLKDQKGSLTPICCDETKEDEVLAMFDIIKKNLGGVDVCINNAGLAHDAPLLSGSTEDWRHMLENLQSDDIVDSLMYALSAPPRCQVSSETRRMAHVLMTPSNCSHKGTLRTAQFIYYGIPRMIVKHGSASARDRDSLLFLRRKPSNKHRLSEAVYY